MKMKIKDWIFVIRCKINFFFLILKNRRTAIKGHCCVHNVVIQDEGHGNKLLTGRNVILENCRFEFIGGSNMISLGDGIRISGVTFRCEKNCAIIEIGKGSWIGPNSFLLAIDNTKIKIGEKCAIARNCTMRTSDSHFIFDSNGRHLNPPQDIFIGNHIWIGEQVIILKGANIEDGCIVGARSLVTSNCKHKDNSIIAGMPARMIKEDITWML